uniref:Uncharacterized protein LOC104244582 n=1 Tax=Nicotiana sylvestris TaxID=4096 RepID=A0A1U7Y2H2_NICSY|nr:PREDICTED: uncharacterized protein LOC104244582 [Nicotiana sylvestris]
MAQGPKILEHSGIVIDSQLVEAIKNSNLFSQPASSLGHSSQVPGAMLRLGPDLGPDIGEDPLEEEGDFNGHIGSSARGYIEVHGDFGFGDQNGGGTSLLDFAKAFELMIANSSFFKREEHLVMCQRVVQGLQGYPERYPHDTA